MVVILHCIPVYLNKIALTMVFGIEITYMPLGDNKFFKLRFLSNKVRLSKQEPVTAAISPSGFTLG